MDCRNNATKSHSVRINQLPENLLWCYYSRGTNARLMIERSTNMESQKERYIKEIMELLEKCNDLDLLELILQIIIKSA